MLTTVLSSPSLAQTIEACEAVVQEANQVIQAQDLYIEGLKKALNETETRLDVALKKAADAEQGSGGQDWLLVLLAVIAGFGIGGTVR